MDHSNEKRVCNQLTEYITDQLNEMDRLRYERHLDFCASCKQEAVELREVWDVMPYTAHRVDPPEDLKEQVMSGIFSEPTRVLQPFSNQLLARRSYWFYSMCTAVIVVILMGTIWNYQLTAERQQIARSLAEQVEQVDQPTVIENLFALSAQSDSASTRAYGVACIAKQGDQSELVVYVYNAANNQGDQAYQVWLVRDTERTNAGTFKVGDDGVGVLTYRMMNEKANFDAIGITLEPDSKGTTPRGKKIFGNTDKIIWN